MPGVATALLVLSIVLPRQHVAMSSGLQFLAVTLTLLVLHVRTGRGGDEALVWRWFTRAALAVELGVAGQFVVVLVTGADQTPTTSTGAGVGGAVSGLACLASCVLLYQGLIVWNRVSTQLAAPGDWLNGISAALAVAALVHLLLAWRMPGWDDTPWWDLQLSVARFSALFIVLGTTLTVAVMSGLQRDPRPWAVGGATLALMVVEVLQSTGTLPHHWAAAGWTAFSVVLAWTAGARAHPVRPQDATTQALTVGTFVVLLASVAIIGLSTRLPPAVTWPSSILAALAVIGVSTRVVRLIADLATLAQTRQEALTDDLTGLANRRAFTVQLQALAQETGERPHAAAVLLLDLDRFKEVNDRYGHDAGDRLLQRTAQHLRDALPPGALLARLGGDEFAVLVRDVDTAEALQVARTLVDATAGVPGVQGPGHSTAPAGASVGVAIDAGAPGRDDTSSAGGSRPEGGTLVGAERVDGNELLRRADAAMYLAKASATSISLYDEALDRAGIEAALMAEELGHVLDPCAVEAEEADADQARDDDAVAALGTGPTESQLRLDYQPQVDVRTGAVVGVEALVRWEHPRRGLLPPAAFLDIVERTGRMGLMTRFVLTEAARQSERWRSRGIHLRVAVNLSASSLSDPGLLQALDDLVDRGLPPAAVVLEVTETVLMQDPLLALSTMAQLRARGFELSIDDYGTGYSSLSYLADVPAAEAKLDRSFTVRVLTDERVRHIVAGTVELAHRLGLRVLAEGVEDEATLQELRRLGVDETQGYLHSRPLPEGSFTAWLEERTGSSDSLPSATGPSTTLTLR